MPPSPFDAVVFDFFCTLTPAVPSATWDEHAARSAAPLGIEAGRWRDALDESFPERVVGALGDLPQTLRTLAARCGVTPDEEALAAACAARLAAQRELFALRPDAEPTLERIAGFGVKVGVLSDCATELADSWPLLPIARYVDAAVLSCREGRRKPDPVLYATVAERLGVAPRRCLYVGDGGGGELSGARAAGMTAVLLRAVDWAADGAPGREADWSGPVLGTLSAVGTALDYPVMLRP
ncbi:HAD family hydrolase [Kitasatospora sp. NPDC049285]|uniref:HAD family hydrolase n=1 Tax=Kitasatospora sp. NPDC049285 TaxID=3157096 RepID=UPI003444D9B6